MDKTLQPSREALVAGYIRYAEALSVGVPPATPEMSAAESAYDAVERVVRRGPASEAWMLTQAVLRAAPNDRLDVYAAGVLESLVRGQGTALVAEIESAAAGDERFRWALGRIWLTEGDLPADVMGRIVQASGGAIQPLPRNKEARER